MQVLAQQNKDQLKAGDQTKERLENLKRAHENALEVFRQASSEFDETKRLYNEARLASANVIGFIFEYDDAERFLCDEATFSNTNEAQINQLSGIVLDDQNKKTQKRTARPYTACKRV